MVIIRRHGDDTQPVVPTDDAVVDRLGGRHAGTGGASPHCWGTAANIYRIGDTFLDTPDAIRRYATLVHDVIPTAWTRPLGDERMLTDDHLHVDLGYVISVPREAPGETYNLKLAGDPL